MRLRFPRLNIAMMMLLQDIKFEASPNPDLIDHPVLERCSFSQLMTWTQTLSRDLIRRGHQTFCLCCDLVLSLPVRGMSTTDIKGIGIPLMVSSHLEQDFLAGLAFKLGRSTGRGRGPVSRPWRPGQHLHPEGYNLRKRAHSTTHREPALQH